MDTYKLTAEQRKERMCIRNFLSGATHGELLKEREIRPTPFRIACIDELIDELYAESGIQKPRRQDY